MTGITKAVVCAILVNIKDPLLLIEKSSTRSGDSGLLLSRYLSGPLLYVRRHITVNKTCLVRR